MRVSLVRAAVAFTCASSLGCARAHAQRTPRPPRFEPARAERVAELLGALAHDSMEGRDTGTRGGYAAARMIAAALREAGAQPAGDTGSYFQLVPLVWSTVRRSDGAVRYRPMLVPDSATRANVADHARVEAYNVVGVIRGGDARLRDTAVVITAHYDHTGIGAPVDGDSIMNGADDDASGVVAVIEVARILATQRPAPRRTVVFLLVTGEERGLLGTRWYLQSPVVPLARTAANLNVEMIARPDSLAGGPGTAWLTGFERSTMGRLLREAGIPLVPDPRPAQNFFMRSDNIAFALRGIPAHTISSYNLHGDYHTPKDEARFADAAHMAAVIDATARAARLLADGPAVQWEPGGRPEPRRR